jgi:hypothetical protein
MEIESLNQFIKRALEYYDNQKLKYYDFIKNQDVTFNINENKINFHFDDDSISKEFQILGYFDNQNNIWLWGWLLNDLSFNTTKTCRFLLEYGLKLEPSSKVYSLIQEFKSMKIHN